MKDKVKVALETGDDGEIEGSCPLAIGAKVAGKTCCPPLEKLVKCIGLDFPSCPSTAQEPLGVPAAVIDLVVEAFKAGGYCDLKPWAMSSADAKKYIDVLIAAANEKKVKCGSDAGCIKAAEDEITALQDEAQAIGADDETTTSTTTTVPAGSAAFTAGPVPAATLAAFSVATAVAATVL